MILLKQLLLESYNKRLLTEQTTTTYEFRDSFPDNIVLPINPKQLGITSFDKITAINQLTPNLQNFINTLKSAILSKKLIKGNITITASADGNTPATKQIPGDGTNWNQAQVDFSYSNGATVSNQTLADRRAQGIEYIIKRFVKLPAEVTITKTGNGSGTKKMVTVVVPITTYNLSTPKTNITNPKTKKIEIFDLAAAKYTVPSYTDVKIPIAKCNGNLQANGLAGNPIAFRSKLEAKSGPVTMNFIPAYIPDRLVITQYDKTKKTTKIIHDTGYVSDVPTSAQVDFGTVLSELNGKSKIGYNGTINAATPIDIDLGNVPNVEYFVEIYAPLGPTIWSLSINCQVSATPQSGGKPTKVIPVPLQFTKIPDYQRLYWNKDYTQIVAATDPNKSRDLAWAGVVKNNKWFDGELYIFDKDGILTNIDVYQNGVYTGQGQV
jgi:hypothetical protein